MALEIKSTPKLKGESANRFLTIVAEKQDNKVSKKKKLEMNQLVDSITSSSSK